MLFVRFKLIAFSLLFLFFGSFYHTAAQENSTINAERINSAIKFDGYLDEKVWKQAMPATSFTQQELVEGDPATEKTEVRILYNDENLYVGVICYDSEPDKIINREQKRDADLENDDNFSLVIDTFHDKQNAFYFSTNPNGARLDAQVVDIGDINTNWNSVWDVRARIIKDGWSAEILIPFKTLRFPRTAVQVWGVNFKRVIRRKNEEVLWCAWGRDDGILQLTKCGILTGLMNIKRGRQLEFKPYILGGLEKKINDDPERDFKYGLDVKYPLTSDLTLDITALTDFAQVEIDQEQINLTRFSLRYPEKRDFFLEGAEIFTFASPYTNPFYSRRIGIAPDSTRKEIPILGGAKVTGKAGSYQLGLINMQTDREGIYPSTNYSVVRLKKEVLEKSYIGIIGTNVHNADKEKDQTLGVDFYYRTDKFLGDKNFAANGYVANNWKTGVKYGTKAGRFMIDYPNDLNDIWFLFHAVGENYSPRSGYVRRGNIEQHLVEYNLNPRPDIPYVNKLLLKPVRFDYITDVGSTLLSRTIEIRPLGVELNSGDEFRFEILDKHEYISQKDIDEGNNVIQGIKIPRGVYKWKSYEFEIESSEARKFSAGIEADWGDYFDGDKKSVTTKLAYKAGKYYGILVDYAYHDITLGNTQLERKIFSGKLNVNFSTRLSSSMFLQWNNETNDVLMNFRLHYIPKIGSDVYLVYNQIWDEEDEYRTIKNTGILKISYLLYF